MANEIGIGLSPITDKIYVGKQNKAKRMWVGEKKDITENFLDVMFEYLALHELREIVIENDKKENMKHYFLHFINEKNSLQKIIKFAEAKIKKLEQQELKNKTKKSTS